MAWVSCQTINADHSLSTPDKLKLWISIYDSLMNKHSLNQSHVDLVAGVVLGGFMLGISNASSEDATVEWSSFSFPSQSLDSFNGVKIDHSTMKSFGFNMQMGTSGDAVTIPPKSVVHVPAFVYGCDPTGLNKYRMLYQIYTTPKHGPIGDCAIEVKLSNSTEEAELSKSIDCNYMVLANNLQCPK
jgi:hypothetical protein